MFKDGEGGGVGVKMTDLRPLPKLAPHGDIRFIYEKDGGMTGEQRDEKG